MGYEIEVKPAKDLGVTAPSGDVVAVLDQNAAMQKSGASPVQDHHNGILFLPTNQIEGNRIKIKGKYYQPSSTNAAAKSLRFTVRKQNASGMIVYADRSLPLDEAFDQWVDFELELPLDEGKEPLPDRNYLLMLSAVPLAGPIYLDNLQVTDSQDNPLWNYPEFE